MTFIFVDSKWCFVQLFLFSLSDNFLFQSDTWSIKMNWFNLHWYSLAQVTIPINQYMDKILQGYYVILLQEMIDTCTNSISQSSSSTSSFEEISLDHLSTILFYFIQRFSLQSQMVENCNSLLVCFEWICVGDFRTNIISSPLDWFFSLVFTSKPRLSTWDFVHYAWWIDHLKDEKWSIISLEDFQWCEEERITKWIFRRLFC